MPRTISDWITLNEAVALFAAAGITISRSTLARWAATGKLQSIRPGRQIYVRRAQIRALLRPKPKGVPARDAVQAGLFEDWTD